AVLLEKDKAKISWREPFYGDLTRVHRVLRYALADQLENANDYAVSLKSQVAAAPDDEHLQFDVTQVAAHQQNLMSVYTKRATDKLRKSYDEVEQDVSWRTDVNDAQRAGAEFKQGISAVT